MGRKEWKKGILRDQGWGWRQDAQSIPGPQHRRGLNVRLRDLDCTGHGRTLKDFGRGSEEVMCYDLGYPISK